MLSRFRRRLDRDEGISIVELMIVTALLGVIMPPAFTFLMSATRSERQVSEATRQQQDARTAMESFSRHLREAGYAEGLTYSQSSIFLSAGINDVIFYTDFDGDGINERVSYALNTGTSSVDRTIVEPDCASSPCLYSGGASTSSTVTVIEHVRNGDLTACGEAPGTTEPVFRFYQVDSADGSLDEIPTPTTDINNLVDINYMEMVLIVDVTPGQSPVCQRLSTAVSLRNWRG